MSRSTVAPLDRRLWLAAALLVALGGLLYGGAALRLAGAVAFPLDDAWIHQTYARTLAESGEWAFRAGQPSSGSTAPLWTLLLVPAHLVPALSPVLWSHALGLAGWLATVVLGGWLSWTLFGERTIAAATVLALAVEWHLAWAAMSGMEIPLYSALALGLLALYVAGRGTPLGWGLLGGALTLARPEGLLVLAWVGGHWLWRERARPIVALRGLGAIGAGWLVWVVPYALFNWWVSGLLFPNTFYAKQQEYGILLAALPGWQRVGSLLWQPWLGGQTLLLLSLPWLPWRRLRLVEWLPLLWAASIVLVYALRLPVTYQHGRYLMPTIPVFLVYGVAGFGYALLRVPPVLRRALVAGVGTAFVLFWLLGASAYGTDVSIIECEMHATARWVAAHSAPDDLIAAHDIGRLGYVARRPLLDFAGLVSPETIPIIRDEAALLGLAVARDARYLVTFADWYPTMVQDPRLVPRYAPRCPATQQAGQAPMTVYEIVPP